MTRTAPGGDRSAEQPSAQQPSAQQDHSAEHPDQEDGAVPDKPEEVAPSRSRRHHRVLAPATNPSADASEDTVARTGPEPGAPGESARDAWIRAQRPPHWG
ncbi:hypothetical protein [Ornithinimicrobium avium]|uniref:Uncharacterized protein n=1 Tax=Ornithinimicrobium avium TaxID=2283195 RepID=A0A345NQE7_9MICO|nr:hypothetical protein [Ornithinimicrobium avium]AXH97255.1 hypothetical protein DV701_15055 [Ornithinimicrobium avium]